MDEATTRAPFCAADTHFTTPAHERDLSRIESSVGWSVRIKSVAPLCLGIWIAGCSDPQGAVTPSATKASSDQLSLSEDERSSCGAYGLAAGLIVADRESGIPYPVELNKIVTTSTTSDAAKELGTLVRLLYRGGPAFEHLTQDGAEKALAVDCEVRTRATKGGAKTYDDSAAIDRVLADFHTYTGQPLPTLLRSYGVRIDSVQVIPAAVYQMPGDKPGDLVFEISYASGPSKRMPCELGRWLGARNRPVDEFYRRGSVLPAFEDGARNPTIYWAATGKCSDDYTMAAE